jgi:hypothetical protein
MRSAARLWRGPCLTTSGETLTIQESMTLRPRTENADWKPFFHRGVAAALSGLSCPFVFAIDANEPRATTLARVTFHWRDGQPGAHKFAALLGLEPVHRGW